VRLSSKVLWSFLTLLISLPLFGETTWYLRPDGGTRYSTNARKGQCDGKTYAAYRGNGVNQHCAFYDNRFLYDLDSFNVHLSDTSPARGPYCMRRRIHLCRRNYA
jgi:hypothetical protein